MADKKPARKVRCLDIYKNKRMVLKIEDRPGILLSTAPPSPFPNEPVKHPFLTAQAFDAASEDELRKILLQSKSFDEYVKRLVNAGYEAVPCKTE